MTRLLTIWISLMWACTGQPHEGQQQSVSLESTLFIRLQQTLDLQQATEAFSPTARPENFPLSAKRAIRIERLRRLQTIDGRLIAEYAVIDGTEQKSFTVWFEQYGGQWLIAGWTPIKTRPTGDAQFRSWLDFIPKPLAANALRGRAREMTVAIPVKPTTHVHIHDAQKRVKLGLNLRANPACHPVQMKKKLRAMQDRFKQCYASQLVNQRIRQGRLTIDIVSQGATKDTRVSLRESTLVDPTLTDCTLQVARSAVTTPIPNCIATLRLTFKPNQKH